MDMDIPMPVMRISLSQSGIRSWKHSILIPTPDRSSARLHPTSRTICFSPHRGSVGMEQPVHPQPTRRGIGEPREDLFSGGTGVSWCSGRGNIGDPCALWRDRSSFVEGGMKLLIELFVCFVFPRLCVPLQPGHPNPDHTLLHTPPPTSRITGTGSTKTLSGRTILPSPRST